MVKSENVSVFKDGSDWCATRSDFIDLQKSPSGFGDTPDEAIKALQSDEEE